MADSDLPDSISSLSSLPYDALNLPEPQSRSILSHPLLDHLQPTTYSLPSLTAAIDTFLASKDADQPRATTATTATLIHSASAALSLFLQINVTGPPPSPALSLNSRLFPSDPASRATITRDLSVDGVAVYSLIPNVELLAFAVAIARSTLLFHYAPPAALAVRMRTNVCHQKMLHEVTQTLQDRIYADLRVLLTSTLKDSDEKNETAVSLLIESATINILHGFDAHARADLARAAELNRFHFAVTGWLGKRTKFQDRDISQLVVLAKSEDTGEEGTAETAPKHVDLEDDTLLDKISFKKQDAEAATTVQSPDSLPPALSSLDPSNQPPLAPLDSIILLATASAITNTSPQHGLTREETLPYAVRVIESGSKNWQVYSQALLLRSKIEGYRSRTIERGLLQLQALVDQVIADTTEQPNTTTPSTTTGTTAIETKATTFLPRPSTADSAPAHARLRYLWLLDFKTRWLLESELASRWVSVGGLRTALDIYARLHMWAEVALCHAATEEEGKARQVVRRLLFRRSSADDEEEVFEGEELPAQEMPADAPRLFCILGDLDSNPTYYTRAWDLSHHRFARAQRSLARWYIASATTNNTKTTPDFAAAEKAYAASLRIDRLNHPAWFALGCVRLELSDWKGAAEAFTRAVRLEEEDAEAWSNLAAALVRLSETSAPDEEIDVDLSVEEAKAALLPDEDETLATSAAAQAREKKVQDAYKLKRDALTALRRAAKYKRDDARIWENLLTVAASIPPAFGTPFEDVVSAVERVLEIRGGKEGEKCVDGRVLGMLVDVLTGTEEREPRAASLEGRILRVVSEGVRGVVTGDAGLWVLVGRVERWRGRFGEAVECEEKAWRAVVSKYSAAAFGMGEVKAWEKIVEATVRVVREGYAGVGRMVVEDEGGESQVVLRDWRFKCRSALRSVLGKGKEYFEGSEGWARLKEVQEEVAGGNA